MSVASFISEDHSITTESEDIESFYTDDLDTSNVDETLQKEFQLFNSSLIQSALRRYHRNHYPKLKAIIEKFGVNDAEMEVLMDLIHSNKLAMSQTRQLIDLCLPRGLLKSKFIIRIFQHLGLRSKTASTKDRDSSGGIVKYLLRWAIAMYEFIDRPQDIVRLYGVLFHYLDVKVLRPEICHLLYFMTSRHHVKQYRIDRLLDLLDKAGSDVELVSLLRVYTTYNPNISHPSIKHSRKAVFTNPMPGLHETMQGIRKIWHDDEGLKAFEFSTYKPELPAIPNKRQRRIVDEKPIKIPAAQTTNPDRSSVTIEEIRNVVQLAEKLDRLALPDQMASILDNRLLQHMIVCDPRESNVLRLNSWLSRTLEILSREHNRSKEYRHVLSEILRKCIIMARLTKAHLASIETFLKDFISKWNGWEFEDAIFELLTFIKPQSFEDMNNSFLKPLYRLYTVSNVQWKAKLILCYTEWLKNWALLDWKRHSERRKKGTDSDMDDLVWLFQGLDFNVDYFQAIQHFIYHVDRLSVIGLVMEGDHPLLQHASLSFFEFVSMISISHDIPEIIIPAAPLIYRSFFSMSGMAVSRICGIIQQYKRAFEENDQKIDGWVTRHTQEYLDNFNTHVMDICCALWRNTALTRSNEAELPFSLSPEITNVYDNLCESRGESANLMLSLTHSGCLAGFSERFIQEKENEANLQVRHEGPVTAQSLQTLSDNGGISISYVDYRVELLDHLQSLGFQGLYDLLYDCMSSLIERKQNEQIADMES
ncbi:Mis6-domain-containing protein [Phascolomyces articulosus]|uniref:Mis6-domain-containing protein n=1 Tax=Phascolomyces articulosus TaxID=60185 RepID=A0AAD5JVX1_9FUNG|nr:Mis6-domain-containing protein [Phascolomyces articulosus]